VERRRLACAIGAKQADYLAGTDLDGHSVDDLSAAKLLDQISCDEPDFIRILTGSDCRV
jgi:hypothetical protein